MPIDYSKYPPNWKTEIVPAVLERARCRCEVCGLRNHSFVWAVKLCVKNDEGRYTIRSIWFRARRDAEREATISGVWAIKIKVVLTVAHLDHDETNHEVSLDRLRGLCQLCHLRYDAKEKYRRSTEKWGQQSVL